MDRVSKIIHSLAVPLQVICDYLSCVTFSAYFRQAFLCPYSPLSRGFFISFFGLFIEEKIMSENTYEFLILLLLFLLIVLFIGDPDLHDALLKLIISKAGA